MALAVAEKGYAKVVVADVHQRAGVSRKTFYAHFDGKEDCFLAAYDATVDIVLDGIAAAVACAGHDVFAAGEAAATTYTALLADNPALARTFLVEVMGAGPAALRRRRAVHQRFADQLAGIHALVRQRWPEVPEPPAHRFLAAVGATNELVSGALLTDGPEAIRGMAGVVLDVQIGLLVGHDTAARLLA
jgi:AcrR family transcriptional regulator